MGFAAKLALIAGLAVFLGASSALWLQYGGAVYASYLSGALMMCI
ncbi:MAG: hypothetical protein ABJM29_08135 [Rhizobiaceae bacterium]